METAKRLRELAVELRKAASSMEEHEKTASLKQPKELDAAKVRDFLMFFGGRNGK